MSEKLRREVGSANSHHGQFKKFKNHLGPDHATAKGSYDLLAKRTKALEDRTEKLVRTAESYFDLLAENALKADERMNRVERRFDDLQQTMIDGFDRNLAILRRLDHDRLLTNDRLKILEAKVGF